MTELYIEPVGLTQSLQLYLDGKRLDKEIAQLVAIANNPNASLGDRKNAAIALSALHNDSNFTKLFDYLPEKKLYCDSAISNTMSYLSTCIVPGLTDSNDAPVNIKEIIDDCVANKTTVYKMATHFDQESSIDDFSNISFTKFTHIVDNGVLLGYHDGKPVYDNDFGKEITLDDGRTVVMNEHRTCNCNACYDVTVTGTASKWGFLKSSTASDASLKSKYC